MNDFGEFLYALRKEKSMTQAELANSLGVTNKAVSKWETGEAMPETSLLIPISRIFGVTVDELLAGKRNMDKSDIHMDKSDMGDDIKNHIFTRGNDEKPKTLLEKICGVICGGLFFAGLAAYLLMGAIWGLWHPYWVIIPVCALSCGIVGCIFDLCNPVKRAKRAARENPYTGCACGIIMLVCVIAYLLSATFTGLWHPLWLIPFSGGMVCFIVGAVGDIFNKKK